MQWSEWSEDWTISVSEKDLGEPSSKYKHCLGSTLGPSKNNVGPGLSEWVGGEGQGERSDHTKAGRAPALLGLQSGPEWPSLLGVIATHTLPHWIWAEPRANFHGHKVAETALGSSIFSLHP